MARSANQWLVGPYVPTAATRQSGTKDSAACQRPVGLLAIGAKSSDPSSLTLWHWAHAFVDQRIKRRRAVDATVQPVAVESSLPLLVGNQQQSNGST